MDSKTEEKVDQEGVPPVIDEKIENMHKQLTTLWREEQERHNQNSAAVKAMEERIRIADERHRANAKQKSKRVKEMRKQAKQNARSSDMLSTIDLKMRKRRFETDHSLQKPLRRTVQRHESEDRFSVKKRAVDNIARQLDDVKDIESKLLLENENLAEELSPFGSSWFSKGNLPIEVRQAIDSNKRSGETVYHDFPTPKLIKAPLPSNPRGSYLYGSKSPMYESTPLQNGGGVAVPREERHIKV